ncbi:MAG: hypothetical protein WCH44_04075 [Betaproteobacteria bacterium]
MSLTPAGPMDAAGSDRLAHAGYSLQLPIRRAAHFEALRELHPDKVPSQLMRDVVCFGLAALECDCAHAQAVGAVAKPDANAPIYPSNGPFSAFRKLTFKHSTWHWSRRWRDA